MYVKIWLMFNYKFDDFFPAIFNWELNKVFKILITWIKF